jgi:general stress protein 26
MKPDTNLSFIKERITEIGSALLYRVSNERFKTSCSIINILNADEKGQLWFFTSRPYQHLSQGEKTFPVRLSFYRKGKPFFVEVSGQACVSEDKKLINHFAGMQGEASSNAMQNLMLVRLKIKKAEFHESRQPKSRKKLLPLLAEFCLDLFKPSNDHRSFEMKPEII